MIRHTTAASLVFVLALFLRLSKFWPTAEVKVAEEAEAAGAVEVAGAGITAAAPEGITAITTMITIITNITTITITTTTARMASRAAEILWRHAIGRNHGHRHRRLFAEWIVG